MGRVKLKIKKLENTNGRQATYAKRKNGIIKKASELSILCDIDIILLMFSPTGKPSLCRGRRSNFEEIITKFAQMTPQERAKRKLESLEALKKTFKKLDHDVNVQEFYGTSSQTIEELSNQSKQLQTLISERNKRLSHWTDFGKISDAEKLEQMENSLKESLNQIRTCKENIQKQQLASLQCNNNQFNEMRIPFIMNADQHLQPLSWIANSDSQNMVLQEDSRFLQHRDVEGSTSSSFGTYASYLGSSSKTDISNSGQENGVLSDLSSNAPVRLQLNGQFPCQPYNFNVLNDIKFQLEAEMNPHENHVDYHVNGRFEAPRPGYDSNQYNWTSTSGPCAVTMLDEYLISQTSFPQVHFGFT
ncbi:PREDICTED: agamous-like MADS-box protein AGL30 [Lupinus angustifolius]|uniref:agamous-like MADS-box protein AGL30 n=1 Tax=Lupinus angustifolius TaxID=3871 RepID=UPI00092F1684|nr:PREDICTED: agamous-like MADS-box protein AGL30 [Lupinus angustifolius]